MFSNGETMDERATAQVWRMKWNKPSRKEEKQNGQRDDRETLRDYKRGDCNPSMKRVFNL